MSDRGALATILAACVAHWQLKLVGGAVVNVLFWLGYFNLSSNTVTVRITPLLALDGLIPFWRSAAPIYLSQFLTLPMLVVLIDTRDELLAFLRATAWLSASCFVVFAFMPTEMPRPLEAGAASDFYGWIVSYDTTRNAFPSLHAGFGALSAILATRVFARWRYRNALCLASWTLTVAVMIAALLIKQHSVCDILAGCGLGVMAALLGRLVEVGHRPLKDAVEESYGY